MDKNMINIDELVRLRLSGGEEHERPGSWANMRELLDQEMPTNRPVAAYNWRRMLGVMTGIALLSALFLGGYHVMSTKFADNGASKASAANRAASPAKTSGGAGYIAANKPTNKETAGITTFSQKNAATANTNKSTTPGTAKASASTVNTGKTDKLTVNQTVNNNKLSGKGNNSITAANVNTSVNNKATTSDGQSQQAVNMLPANNAVTASAVSATEKHMTKETTFNDLLASGTKPNTTSNNDNSNTPVKAPAADQSNDRSNVKTPIAQPITNLSAAAPDNTATANIKTPAPLEPTMTKDSFSAMTVRQRSVINPVAKTRVLISDTISVQRLALEGQGLASADGQQAQPYAMAKVGESTSPPNPSSSISLAAAKADASIKEDLVSLSNFKVKSRRTSKWDAQAFQDKMRDVKFNLAQIRFYPGVSAGYSYMSTRNISGVQFGLFGLVTFGENWNAMAELKYSHRFNSGSVLQDNYSIVKPSGTGFLQSNVEHFFKFSTLQSIEMPIALRYAAGRLNLFGGINMNYNFAVDAEEVTVFPDESQYAPVTTPDWANTKPTISYSDFQSRFGLGYLLGAGYELSPAIQLDLRATKNVWDNATGTGAQKVSQQLYRAPTFQVSIFYRFSQKNQIPKAK